MFVERTSVWPTRFTVDICTYQKGPDYTCNFNCNFNNMKKNIDSIRGPFDTHKKVFLLAVNIAGIDRVVGFVLLFNQFLVLWRKTKADMNDINMNLIITEKIFKWPDKH